MAMNSEARKRAEAKAAVSPNWAAHPRYRVVYHHGLLEEWFELVGEFVSETMTHFEFRVPSLGGRMFTVRVERDKVREIWSTTRPVTYPARFHAEERVL